MEYRIEQLEAMEVVCKRKQVTKQEDNTAAADVSAFWQRCGADGTMEQICRLGRFDRLHGVLGIAFPQEMEGDALPYGIGAQYGGAPLDGAALELLTIPAATYAVFPCRGAMPQAFQDTYKRIFTEFFPQSGYEPAAGAQLELYPTEDVRSPDCCCEIWVAVKQRA